VAVVALEEVAAAAVMVVAMMVVAMMVVAMVVAAAMAMVVAAAMAEAADNAGLRYIKFKCQAVDDDLTNSAKMYMYTYSCPVMFNSFYRIILMFLLPRSEVYL
jgi:hypothetical protein